MTKIFEISPKKGKLQLPSAFPKHKGKLCIGKEGNVSR